MAILIDSDVVIQAERGLFDLFGWLASLPNEEFRLAAITVSELWHGAERASGNRRMKRISFLEGLFATFEIEPFTGATALVHARIWAEMETSGRIIGAHDVILAATAIEGGHSVATFNVKHFSAVSALQVIEPK